MDRRLSVQNSMMRLYAQYIFLLEPNRSIQHYARNLPLQKQKVKMFTADELAEFDGIKNKKVYLAVIGEIFDVSKGHKYYGPDQSQYSGFAAKDGSRAFAVGGFTEKELIPDITDLEPSQVISIYEWMTFYRKDYIPKGKLIVNHQLFVYFAFSSFNISPLFSNHFHQ